MGGKTSTASKLKYNKKAYYTTTVAFPAGRKNDLQARAASLSLSVNEYINMLVRADLGITPAAWKDKPAGENDL